MTPDPIDPATPLRRRGQEAREFALLTPEERTSSGPYAEYRVRRQNDAWVHNAIRRTRETLEEWQYVLDTARRSLAYDGLPACAEAHCAMLKRLENKAQTHVHVQKTRLAMLEEVARIRDKRRLTADALRTRVELDGSANATVAGWLRSRRVVRSEVTERSGVALRFDANRSDCIWLRPPHGRRRWVSFDDVPVVAHRYPDGSLLLTDAPVED